MIKSKYFLIKVFMFPPTVLVSYRLLDLSKYSKNNIWLIKLQIKILKNNHIKTIVYNNLTYKDGLLYLKIRESFCNFRHKIFII